MVICYIWLSKKLMCFKSLAKEMTIKVIVVQIMVFLLAGNVAFAQQTEGYYKDLFMDGGVGLTSRTSLYAADGLGLSMEYLATSDEDIQSMVMISNENDANHDWRSPLSRQIDATYQARSGTNVKQ